ncbi:uncharacterized protein LOC134207775 isoform X2 [Armigeres subalbatus]
MDRSPCSMILILTATLFVNLCSGDWVEIPFLQPSTTTQKTTVIRKNINHPSFVVNSGFMSHVLPPFSIGNNRDPEESEDGVSQPYPAVNHATLSPPVRISNLIDFEELKSTTSTSEPPVIGFPNKYSNFQKRIYEYPRGNVSTKLGWTPPRDELHFVTSNLDKISFSQVDRHPVSSIVKPDHQPMSNKYQEESIEYLNPGVSIPTRRPSSYPAVNDRIEIPTESYSEEDDGQSEEYSSSSEKAVYSSIANRTSENGELENDRFHDFDDYDEVHPEGTFKNVTIVKRRRRPGPQGQVTIVKVFPPRRHLRPADSGNGGGFSGFVNFIKRMQDTFMKRTAKNIGDKIKVLQDLKDQLLLSIEKRMAVLWRDPNAQKNNDEKQSNRRVKRGGGWMDYGDGGHGGMDFPSAEAALLTISFLTFAVFLIKLVLQVINTIKSKHYSYNTLAGVNGLNAATLKIVNRNKRGVAIDPNDHWKHNLDILSAINNYKFS